METSAAALVVIAAGGSAFLVFGAVWLVRSRRRRVD